LITGITRIKPFEFPLRKKTYTGNIVPIEIWNGKKWVDRIFKGETIYKW